MISNPILTQYLCSVAGPAAFEFPGDGTWNEPKGLRLVYASQDISSKFRLFGGKIVDRPKSKGSRILQGVY